MRWIVFGLLFWVNLCAGGVIYYARDLSPERVDWARQLAVDLAEGTGITIKVKPIPFWGVLREPWLVLTPRLFLRLAAADEPFTTISAENWIGAWVQENLGVRCLAPGEIERIDQPINWVPFNRWWDLQKVDDRQALSNKFPRREFLGISSNWNEINGITRTPDRHHAHFRIIVPEDFDTHPHLFAKDESGKPKRPPFSEPNQYNDHPDLLEPLVEERVTNAAIAAFSNNNTLQEFSILPNDSYVFGHIPERHAHLRPKWHFGGWLDYSNYVYDFANRVAARVEEEFPDRYLINHSYMLWLNVPDFPVHPNVFVPIADDRTQWYDPEFKERDIDLIRRWMKAGPEQVGAVDYIFSEGFFIPRSLTQIVSESIPLFYEMGLRSYTSFVGANWAYDAHTNWLAAQLLWDVRKDPAALLNEFFSLYYGPVAVPMRMFFDLAEEAWMTQGGEGRWLKYWRNPNQVDLLLRDSERIPAMEAELTAAEAAVEDVADGRYARRVGYTRQMWEVTKAVVALQQARWQYTRQGFLVSHGGMGMSERLVEIGKQIGKLEDEILEKLDTMVTSDPRFSNLEQVDWLFKEDPRVREYEGRGIIDETGVVHGYTRGTLMLSGFSDFERLWRVSNVDWEGSLIEKRGEVIYAENVARGQIAAAIPTEVGKSYRLDVGFRGKISPSSFVHVSGQVFDEDWQQISTTKWDRLPPGEYDERILLGPVVEIPEGGRYLRLFIRLFEMEPGDWLEIGTPVEVWKIEE
jgi:hypothetical protein